MKETLTRILLLFLMNASLLPAKAQKEGNIWYFGVQAGIDFNNCDPVALTNGSIDGFEGCATIAHRRTGKVLFYTNSARVWNKEHKIMMNGELVPYGSTITQVAIVPDPGDSDRYYIITSDIQACRQAFLSYHIVDMKADSGRGALLSKYNVLTHDSVTEKLSVVKHTNGKDFWIIAHQYGTNTFLSYLLPAR